MFRVLIVGDATEQIEGLIPGLTERGFTCSITADYENVVDQIIEQNPQLVLIPMDGSPDASWIGNLVDSIKRKKPLVTMALLSRETIDLLDSATGLDDFVLDPWDAAEVATRAKRVLRRSNLLDNENLIRCEDLMIDQSTCEVTISGKLIELTFKEYELLIFLSSNRGRVFTREVLLDKVWGYDYFGGDRTVDVHIRRLRSKIEDANHTFIETVRNIGYKFIKK